MVPRPPRPLPGGSTAALALADGSEVALAADLVATRRLEPPEPLPWQRAWDAHAEQIKVDIARETGNDIPVTKRHAAGDAKSLRGIPVAAVKGGFGGVSAGTQPEAALIRKERHQRQRRRDLDD